MATLATVKVPKKYMCQTCDYITSRASQYDRHLRTWKHQMATNGNEKVPNANTCESCHKKYNDRSGLWKHVKKCPKINVSSSSNSSNSSSSNSSSSNSSNSSSSNSSNPINIIDANTLVEILKSNNELQKQNHELFHHAYQEMIKEVCKNIQPPQPSNNFITNSHNKTFNLQVFLNEECKDAMNLNEFVDSFKLQFADLESVGELGYVEGMSKLIIKKLNEMDVHKRPIHCSDAKRDILHIKANNKWERETPDYTHLKGAIKCISNKNIDLLFNWKLQHPNVQLAHNPQNDQYLVMIKEVMGGSGELRDSEKKIIRNIAKQVMIEK